jgi:hypothetical protein
MRDIASNEIKIAIKMLSLLILREKFEKFADWRQCAAVMQKKVVTVMPSCSGGGDVVMA